MRLTGFSTPRPAAASALGCTSAPAFALGAVALALSAVAFALSGLAPSTASAASAASGIQKIRHVVIIMQENRSFDTYFGTYPRADGIPGLAGHPGTVPCIPDPRAGGCQRPYHTRSDINAGGPHMAVDAVNDVAAGKMNGFVASVESGHADTDILACPLEHKAANCVDVMGYHDQRELRNYWKYAGNFVLQDHMFEPNLGWSLISHLYMVSAGRAPAPTRSTG